MSGATGYVLDVSVTRTTVLWLSGKFQVGEALIDNNETTTAVTTAVTYYETPFHSLTQDLEHGNWSIGLPPGIARDVFAVGGKIASQRTRTGGQYVEETITDPGFVLVDSYENATPNGFEIIYDTNLSAPLRRTVLRKFNDSANQANLGAVRAHTAFNNSAAYSASSFNIASVARVGTGDYSITFTNPFVAANYSVSLTTDNPMQYAYVYGKTTSVLYLRVATTGTSTLVDLTGNLNVICLGGDI